MGLAAQINALPWDAIPKPNHAALWRLPSGLVAATVDSAVLFTCGQHSDPEQALLRTIDAYVGIAFGVPYDHAKRVEFRAASIPVSLVNALWVDVDDDAATEADARNRWLSNQDGWNQDGGRGAVVEVRGVKASFGVELGGAVTQVQELDAPSAGVVVLAKAATLAVAQARLTAALATLPAGVPSVSFALTPGARMVRVR